MEQGTLCRSHSKEAKKKEKLWLCVFLLRKRCKDAADAADASDEPHTRILSMNARLGDACNPSNQTLVANTESLFQPV